MERTGADDGDGLLILNVLWHILRHLHGAQIVNRVRLWTLTLILCTELTSKTALQQ